MGRAPLVREINTSDGAKLTRVNVRSRSLNSELAGGQGQLNVSAATIFCSPGRACSQSRAFVAQAQLCTGTWTFVQATNINLQAAQNTNLSVC